MEIGKIVLSLIALTAGVYAVVGIARGEIYCKGGPFSRRTEPGRFWLSVAVYCGWAAMMIYFVVFGAPHR